MDLERHSWAHQTDHGQHHHVVGVLCRECCRSFYVARAVQAQVGRSLNCCWFRLSAACRNHVPWAVIGVCIVCRIVLMLTIRAYLFFENKRRDGEERDTTYDEVYIDVTKDGVTKKIRLDKVRTSLPVRRQLMVLFRNTWI